MGNIKSNAVAGFMRCAAETSTAIPVDNAGARVIPRVSPSLSLTGD
jgi:hypothetical protein